MTISIPLKKMTFEEKMQTMEFLWDDLCHGDQAIESPDWHKDILKKREQAIEQGDAEFTDWETAKQVIKNTIK